MNTNILVFKFQIIKYINFFLCVFSLIDLGFQFLNLLQEIAFTNF